MSDDNTALEYEVLASMPKSRSASVLVTRSIYQGKDVADLRVWFVPKQGGPLIPSRRGLMVEAHKLDELCALLLRARDAMRQTPGSAKPQE